MDKKQTCTNGSLRESQTMTKVSSRNRKMLQKKQKMRENKNVFGVNTSENFRKHNSCVRSSANGDSKPKKTKQCYFCLHYRETNVYE